MLKITNLNINVEEITILEDINLEIKEGEVHAIMGPNGAGKSSLANVIAGNPEYTTTVAGTIGTTAGTIAGGTVALLIGIAASTTTTPTRPRRRRSWSRAGVPRG